MALIRKRKSLIQQPPAETGGGLYFGSPKENISFISSGCTMLDCALGGGWPLGRFSNIVGDKSTGKTLLAIEAVANFMIQYPDGSIRYNEAESAFDTDYAGALGVDFARVDFWEDCETVEQFIQDVEGLIVAQSEKKNPQPMLYIVDSIDSLSDKAEREREVTDGSFGAAKAKKLSEFFRRSIQGMKRSNMHLMIISQVRDNLNAGAFGKKHIRTGGKALDFYASQCVWLTHMKRLERTVQKVERVTGIRIKAMVEKNKVGLPFREATFDITFGYGVEDHKASLEWLKLIGVNPRDLKGPALRQLVIDEWYKIEKNFLPTERKYGGE